MILAILPNGFIEKRIRGLLKAHTVYTKCSELPRTLETYPRFNLKDNMFSLDCYF